jgi:hypothetical protein
MPSLKAEKIHVTYLPGVSKFYPLTPRYYTLTHSDRTGDLFLSIGTSYDVEKLSDLYTRFMRDEVLAELKSEDGGLWLNLHYHVCGGFVFGWAKLRYKIFCRFISYNVQTIRFGDKAFFEKNSEFDKAKVLIHFHSANKKYEKTEEKGILSEYKL